MIRRERGVVDPDVHAPEFFDRAVPEILHVFDVADVTGFTGDFTRISQTSKSRINRAL